MKHRRTIEQFTIKNEKDVYHAVNQSALRTLWSIKGPHHIILISIRIPYG